MPGLDPKHWPAPDARPSETMPSPPSGVGDDDWSASRYRCAAVEPCRRPGCTGYIEDGFCADCGLAPLGATSGAAASVAARSTGSPGDPTLAGGGPNGNGGAGASGGAGAIGAAAGRGGVSTLSSRSGRSRSGHSTRSTRSQSTRRRASGVALSALPAIPPVDPLAALVPGEVPERKRFCSNCDAKLARESGFCPKCGQQYSFKPTLEPGSVLAGKYEVRGTVAFGGLGWIYLAMDTVLNRWVVLKGLLNAKDPNMARLAVQEREFLAAVKHRNIVGIYDFITRGTEGFIVMEYVNGKSLLQLRRERGGPLPPLEACSYILEILPAFAYLHSMGLVYCDFKIDNAIVESDTMKLIDMGAVRRADDPSGDIYGTVGYAAPEASDDPTPVSDLYTVARALAVLVADFDFQKSYSDRLPPPSDVAVFRQFPSLHRLLLKATRPEPDTRFQSADEMAGQLQGVLRDIAAGTGVLAQVDSAVFEGDISAELMDDDAGDPTRSVRSRRLPAIRPSTTDPAAGAIVAASIVPDAQRRLVLLEHAWSSHPDSLELPFRLAGAHIEAGSPDDEVGQWLRKAEAADPGDWRQAWYEGQAALSHGDAQAAARAFDTVLAEVPGELAPKLALAYAFELAGDLDSAGGYFDLVSKADPSYTSAAFGLARCQRARGDRNGAVAALERVPGTSSRHEPARLAMAEVLLDDRPSAPNEAELDRASEVLEQLRPNVDTLAYHRLCARLLLAGASQANQAGSRSAPGGHRLLGVVRQQPALRAAAESELRKCAHLAPTRTDKVRYVDEANRARPFTLV